MEDVGQGGLVWSRTTNLDTVFSVTGSSLFETVSDQGHRVIAFRNNEKTDYFFVSVDDEVTSGL